MLSEKNSFWTVCQIFKKEFNPPANSNFVISMLMKIMTCKKGFWQPFNPTFPLEKFYLYSSNLKWFLGSVENFEVQNSFFYFSFNDLLPKRMKSNYWSLNIREILEVVGWGWWSFGLVSSEVKIKRNFSQKTDASSRTFQRKKNLGLQGLAIDGATFQVRPWIDLFSLRFLSRKYKIFVCHHFYVIENSIFNFCRF